MNGIPKSTVSLPLLIALAADRPELSTLAGRRCDKNGNFLPPNAPPPRWETLEPDDFSPFESREAFVVADLLFRRNEMPREQINDLMQCWARTLAPGHDPPFASVDDLLETIDSIQLGHVPWKSFVVSYQPKEGEDADGAPWKLKTYDVWYRDPREVLKNQLSSRDFENEMDFAAKKVVDSKTKARRFQDYMSGEWAWEQSVCN